MIYIVLIVLFLLSLGINIFQFRQNSKINEIIKQKDEVINKASQNMKHLVDHQDIIQNIQKDHNEVYNQIKEAKTDEEVNDIIRNLVDINNRHVHNS